jgi:hypothetical protein
MNQSHSLHTILHIWKEAYTDPAKGNSKEGNHLSAGELYAMAKQDGMVKAQPEAMNHLATCPRCLQEWAAWRRAVTAVNELDDPEAINEEFPAMAYGMREAAATEKPMEPVSMRSRCGRFILGLFPQVDNPHKGMVTLEAVADREPSAEGRHCTIRDRNGLVFLEGKLHHGRLARTCERLRDIDLTTWTLMIDEQQTKS